MTFFENHLMPRAEEIFGNPLPALVKVRMDAERTLFEKNPLLEDILQKGRYIHHLAEEAGLVFRFDARLNTLLSAYLCGLTPLPPVSGFCICGGCGALLDEKTSACPHCESTASVPSVSLPLYCEDYFLPTIRVAPQHYNRLELLVDRSGSFLLCRDEELELLCDLLTEANMKPDDLPALCSQSALELFSRMISQNEVMGCIGCVPDELPYSAFALMDRDCTAPTFDSVTRKLAAFVLNGEVYATRCSSICPVFGHVVPTLPTAEDIYQHLLTHGYWTEAVKLKREMAKSHSDYMSIKITKELLDVLPAPEKALLSEGHTIISKVHALDMAIFSLKLAYIKRYDPISFYRVMIRKMDITELGGKLETPTWCETEVLNHVEALLGLPQTDLVEDHELIEKLFELSENMCFPNLGRPLLLLLDLDGMCYVDEVFRGHEKELHLMDWDWEDWWRLREGSL